MTALGSGAVLLLCALAALAGVEARARQHQQQRRHSKRDIFSIIFSSSVTQGEDGHDCYEGVGLFYRGRASETESGLTCAAWDSKSRRRFMISDVHAGRHNYCRNLHLRRRPWCYVKKNHRLEWEYCDIPRCGLHPLITVTSPAPTTPTTVEALTCGKITPQRQNKIVGGTVTTVEAHPWMAAIFYRGASKQKVFRCGGSLISSCWVLTAAHCFPDSAQRKSRHFSVSLGKNALNESDARAEQTFKVEKVILHEEYDELEGNYNNDIALLKLRAKHGRCAEESVSVRPVCLPPPGLTLSPGTSCRIVGYGQEKDGWGSYSQYLRQTQVNLLADEECRRVKYYGNLITENMFCASAPDWSRDACKGDSGGPLVCQGKGRFFLFGVISWGDGCAREFKPGVYARVGKYNRWIAEKTGLSSGPAGAQGRRRVRE